MIAAFESLLPVFLLIGLGVALKAGGVVREELWRGIEVLAYWVLFPAVLAETLIRAEIASLPLGGIAFTMLAAFFTLAGLLLMLRAPVQRLLGIGGPEYSALFQSSTRWNGFIALPILAKLNGDQGVALVAVVMAVLVPMANMVAVYVVTRNAASTPLTALQTAYAVFRNPFIWATAIGIAINLLGVPVYEPVMTAMHMLGGAAIGCGLLMVGSGLRIAETRKPSATVWLGTLLKLVATPLLVTAWSLVFGVSGVPLLACLVCAAVPTAMSAYVLARQLNGAPEVIAATVTVQTALSFLTIPFWIWWQGLIG